MTIWLTSDQHFGHANIIAYCARPFADVEAMTRGLIERHNAVVGPDDEVWHLGDFALNEKRAPEILPHLQGRHHLVPGNHDKCHPLHKRSAAASERYLAYGFASVQAAAELDGFVLSHLPYAGDSRDEGDRFAEWRPVDDGRWLLHGHVHERWRTRGRMLNVGVDVWDWAPVSLDALRSIRDAGHASD